MKKKVIVIGAGFAGLTAAAYLVKNNFEVTLLEGSPKLGGRAYSFKDKVTGIYIDNGQHILMGCYFETLKFLEMIGAINNFYFQKSLQVNFVKEKFDVKTLKAFPLFYPLNLLFGLLNFKAISFKERISLIKVFVKLSFYSSQKFSQLSVKEWLEKEKQTENVQNAFWKILAVGALNTSIDKASARIFINILKQIFFNGSRAAAIVLPGNGLSETYCKPAEEFIVKNGGEIFLSESVLKLSLEDSLITEIETTSKVYTDFEYVVSAVPAFAMSRLLSVTFSLIIPDFKYSSILNIHLWLEDCNFPPGFYSLINSPLHWVFNKGTHLNIVISDADKMVNKTDEDLMLIVKDEMKKFFSIDPELISNYKIIKEKRATFVPDANSLNSRPSQKTNIKNLVLAGDWVDTGLPSTIESAVKSGRVAAEIIADHYK